jgi:hypothetical protein
MDIRPLILRRWPCAIINEVGFLIQWFKLSIPIINVATMVPQNSDTKQVISQTTSDRNDTAWHYMAKCPNVPTELVFPKA